MAQLPTPSEEQHEIIKAIQTGNNVVVDAVAGSGKTTTILLSGAELQDKKILVITYNARLKAETRSKAARYDLPNIEVHSYHSLGRSRYMDPCITDLHLIQILREKRTPKRALDPDVIVVDEAQDMTFLYFEFVKKVLKDCKRPPQLVVLGDHLQCIYDFPQKGADPRFLTLAKQIYDADAGWSTLFLKTSYRITKTMEWFVNKVLLGYPRMKAEKEHPAPVKYLSGDPFHRVPEYIKQEIQKLLNFGGYKPDDIFILAPSIRSKNLENPVKKLENSLVKAGFPCYVPFSDDEELKDEVLEGKIVFSSFHQSKGLERKIVFACGFSSSFYFVFRDAPKNCCPNVLYVAATRAMERLYLWGDDGGKDKPLPFLKHNVHALDAYTDTFRHVALGAPARRRRDSDESSSDDSTKITEAMTLRRVTELTRFIPDETVDMILELCKMRTIQAPHVDIQIPSQITTEDGKVEAVSELNGIAIPTIYEHRLTERISIQQDLQTNYLFSLKEGGAAADPVRKSWISTMMKDPVAPADYLRLANLYSSYISGYLHKLVQIKDYSWLPDPAVEDLLEVLENQVDGGSEKLEFEYTLSYVGYKWRSMELQIEGRADIIDDECLWEIKCVDTLRAEHVVQLALYAWIWQEVEFGDASGSGSKKFRLFNIRTGEVQELTGIENLGYVVDIILDNHFRMANKINDEEFVAKCADIEKVGVTRAGGGASSSSSAPAPKVVTTAPALFLDD